VQLRQLTVCTYASSTVANVGRPDWPFVAVAPGDAAGDGEFDVEEGVVVGGVLVGVVGFGVALLGGRVLGWEVVGAVVGVVVATVAGEIVTQPATVVTRTTAAKIRFSTARSWQVLLKEC
jgi:hypothetical protein